MALNNKKLRPKWDLYISKKERNTKKKENVEKEKTILIEYFNETPTITAG